MNYFNIINLIVIFSILALGILVLWRGGSETKNKLFFVFIAFLSLWLFSGYLLRTVEDPGLTLFFLRLNYVLSSLMVFALFVFILEFPRRIFHKNIQLSIFVFIPTLMIVLISFSNSLVENFSRKGPIVNAETGNGLYFYLVYIILILLSVLGILVKQYKESSGIIKRQLLFLFFGIFIAAFFTIIADLVIPLVFNLWITANFDPIWMFFLVGFMTYAILKHHLMDIQVILTETAITIVVFAILIQTLVADNLNNRLVSFGILIIVSYGGYLLIKSVKREIEFRQQYQQLSEQLAQANAHLKELDQMKTEFVSLASHELLTPVSAIEGYLSMLLDEKLAKVEDPKALDYLNHVYSSAKRLARLVADMLNVSRIEEGRLLVEKKEVNLSELIKQVVEELKFKSEEQKQKIEFTNPDGWKTFGDADKIKEVIVNLIGNSIKYSKNPGVITVTVEKTPTEKVEEIWQNIEAGIKDRPLDDQEAIKTTVDQHYKQFVGPEQIMIKVKDQGIGIPKEELPKLFKKFHRVGDFSTAESQGTGLGLYISRALVELHHGRIWADSEGQGKGSTFSFTLPDIESKEEIERLEAEVPKKEGLKPLARPAEQADEL